MTSSNEATKGQWIGLSPFKYSLALLNFSNCYQHYYYH
ncbi:unnamed protein product [Tenebrio molitor]|nr:unnamed protein product [Tenebrio molitor]